MTSDWRLATLAPIIHHLCSPYRYRYRPSSFMMSHPTMLFFLQRHYFTLPCWIYYSTTTVNAHALQQPIYQWKASPGSILAANIVSAVTDDHDPSWTTTTMTTTERTMPRVRPILATSGHSDGGTIRFWPILVKDNTTKDEERGGDSSSTIVIDDNMASLSSSSSSSSSSF